MAEKRDGLGRTVLTAVLSGSVVAAVFGTVLKAHVDTQIEAERTRLDHHMAMLTELVGPVVMQLGRSRVAHARYSPEYDKGGLRFGDAAILRDANLRVRTLLLDKGHLMPSLLVWPSQCLVIHYDVWLRLFDEEMAGVSVPPEATDFFDVGIAALAEQSGCGNFNAAAACMYEAAYTDLQAALWIRPRTGLGSFLSEMVYGKAPVAEIARAAAAECEDLGPVAPEVIADATTLE